MTSDPLASLRERLTDEVLDRIWRSPLDGNQFREELMRATICDLLEPWARAQQEPMPLDELALADQAILERAASANFLTRPDDNRLACAIAEALRVLRMRVPVAMCGACLADGIRKPLTSTRAGNWHVCDEHYQRVVASEAELEAKLEAAEAEIARLQRRLDECLISRFEDAAGPARPTPAQETPK